MLSEFMAHVCSGECLCMLPHLTCHARFCLSILHSAICIASFCFLKHSEDLFMHYFLFGLVSAG